MMNASFCSDSVLESIMSGVKKAVNSPKMKQQMVAANGKIFADIEFTPESEEEVCGLFVEYRIAPIQFDDNELLLDFFPDGDFDRAIITLFNAHQTSLDQEKYESMLRSVLEKSIETSEFYEKRSDGSILYIKYDQSLRSWVFKDSAGYKFEPDMNLAARHFMRFSQMVI